MTRRLAGLTLAVIVGSAASGCIPEPRAAVSLKVVRADKTPSDASLSIDEEYVGPLGWVAARGVRLPIGEHRITVEKEGYFPVDLLVVADRKPVRVRIKLVPVPD